METPMTLSALALVFMTTPAFAQGVPGAHFVENFDMNGDGEVTLAEIKEKRGEIFYMLDQDENGVLDSAEYDNFDALRAADHEQMQEAGGQGTAGHGKGGMGQGGQGEGMTREVTDLNGDGEVTEVEFLTAAEAWFSNKDRNNDGVITTKDFGPRRG